MKPGVPRGTCQSASVPPPSRTLPTGTPALPGGMAAGVPSSTSRFPRISLGIPWAEPPGPTAVQGRGCRGCWGSLPHHLAVPQHAVKVRGKDGPPGCCLSTFPARPSVRNGEALSGIRRWLRVIVPLPHQPQHPKHRARGAGTAGKAVIPATGQCQQPQGNATSHKAVPPATRQCHRPRGSATGSPGRARCPALSWSTLSLMTPTKPLSTNTVGTCRAGCSHAPRESHSTPHGAVVPGVHLHSQGWWPQGTWPYHGRAAQAGVWQAALLAPSRRLTSTWQLQSRPCQCLPRACGD